jgi:hypothetical protein
MNAPHTDAPAGERMAAPPATVFPETSPHEPAVRPWELELLISGALVFSLLQMPGYVDTWYEGVRPHVAERTHLGVFMLYMYLKLILYTLISCFVLHLSMRAYWVGLIGLESVFPAGVRWEDSSYGPVMTEVYREKMGRLQSKIDAADRFCSILFPLAFTVVMLFFFSVGIVVVGGGLAFAISRLLWGGEHFGRTFMAIFGAALVVPIATWIVDSRFGKRVERGGRGHRLLRRASTAAYYVNAMPIYGTTLMTLFTNMRKGSRYPAMYALLALLMGVFMVKDVYIGRGILLMGDHLYLPDEEGPFGMSPGVYENQRQEADLYERMPSIQSDVVREPYLKLFIPYAPVRHGQAFAEQCPGAPPLSFGGVRMANGADAPDSAAVRAVLDCWARLQPVALNGRPLRPDFRFYTHPRSGIRGILAYIPVEGLPPGENLLTVGYAPLSREVRAKRAAQKRNADPEHYYIPFWR